MTLFKSSFLILFGTLMVKLSLLGKDVILTKKLGLGDQLSFYLAAFFISSIVSNTLGLSLQVFYTKPMQDNENKLYLVDIIESFRRQLVIWFLFICGIFLFYYFFKKRTSFYIEPVILIICSFYLLLMPIRTLIGQTLFLNNYHKVNFLLAMVSPALISSYILMKDVVTTFDLSSSLILATIFELTATFLYAIRKNLILATEQKSRHSNLSSFYNTLILQIAISSYLLFDQLFALIAGPYFLATFNYASKLPNIISSLTMVLATSVLLPLFHEGVKVDFKSKKIKIFVPLVLFITLLAYQSSEMITSILYERGEFTHNDTNAVSAIQARYFLAAPFMAIFLSFIRFLSSQNKLKLALIYSITSLFVSICSSFILLEFNNLEYIPFSAVIGFATVFVAHYLRPREIN